MPPSSMVTLSFENVTVGVSSPLRRPSPWPAIRFVDAAAVARLLRLGPTVHERERDLTRPGTRTPLRLDRQLDAVVASSV